MMRSPDSSTLELELEKDNLLGLDEWGGGGVGGAEGRGGTRCATL